MDLCDIFFHDCRIIRVIEVADAHDLHFEVQYPVDWDSNLFEPRVIVFLDVLNYRVDEGPIVGPATLLSWKEGERQNEYRSVTLATTAGSRSLLFREVDLRLTNGASYVDSNK